MPKMFFIGKKLGHCFFSEPIGLDPPMIVDIGTRSVNLTWQAPLISNGYIAEYKLYVNGILAKSVSNCRLYFKICY